MSQKEIDFTTYICVIYYKLDWCLHLDMLKRVFIFKLKYRLCEMKYYTITLTTIKKWFIPNTIFCKPFLYSLVSVKGNYFSILCTQYFYYRTIESIAQKDIIFELKHAFYCLQKLKSSYTLTAKYIQLGSTSCHRNHA